MKTTEQIYLELKKIVEPIHAHEDQMLAIAKYISQEYQEKDRPQEQIKEVNLNEIFDFIREDLRAEYTIKVDGGRVLLTLKIDVLQFYFPLTGHTTLESFKGEVIKALKKHEESRRELDINIDRLKKL